MHVERQVAEHLARGETREAATVAIEGYGPAILGYLCALLDEDDARDVFSIWAEHVWRGLPGFRWECPLRAWAYRLAWHAVSRLSRDPYRRRRQRLRTTAASRLAASVASSRLSDSVDERVARLRQSLTPDEHTLLVLRIDRGLSWDEVADVLAGERPVSPSTLRKRFERIKAKLARRARESGLVER